MDSGEKKTFSIIDTFGKSKFDADIEKAQSFDSLVDENNGSTFPWYIWLFIILILTFLIFFIYMYFSKGSFSLTSLFDSAKENMNFFLEKIGLKKEIPVINAGQANVEILQNVGSSQGERVENMGKKDQINDAVDKSTLYKTLNSTEPEKPKDHDYKEDISHSTIQQIKTGNKSGWCFIGEDRGFRSCAKVNDDDKCMSGNIFPSQEICINPNLRV